MKESFLLLIVKLIGILMRVLPLSFVLALGRGIGLLAYYWDYRHRAQAYANLKMAFAQSKTPKEIREITKDFFKNFGMNVVELFRLPLIDQSRFNELVQIKGRENVAKALEKGKGVILLAMHMGSWEMASLLCAMLGHSYRVMVKPQKKFSKLDELLNEYRSCRGSVVISRGFGTRDMINGLKNNEVIGMVVDQGGRDGMLIPFFGRRASMSVGAVRLALKMDIPICFCVVARDANNINHQLVIEAPFELTKTKNTSKDVADNLAQITMLMEKYVSKFPQEYMWFYKIWKYSTLSKVVLLSDGKIGHEKQSQSVVRMLAKALDERNIKLETTVVKIVYKNKTASQIHSFLSSIIPAWISQGHLDYLKMFLTTESYLSVIKAKADFVVSCGSSVAGLNYHFAKDHCAKSIAILKPGISSLSIFDRVILPEHDKPNFKSTPENVVLTKGSPNLITKEYLRTQSELLLNRYSHLKSKMRFKIGVFIGGDSKNVYLSVKQMRIFVHQIKDIARQINADILLTTSRRTPKSIESLLFRELKKDKHCPLMIQANQEDVPEAVGGMMGLSDLLIVSGDSLSMISEAASSGKKTIVFKPMGREILIKDSNKHEAFAIRLHDKGYIFLTDVKHIGLTISNIIMSKIQTRKLDDNKPIFEALKHVI